MSTPGIPGFEEISALATKYSPQQIQLMAAQGMIDLGTATRAKFLQDRIAAEVARANVPTTTVAQDVMAPPQPAAPAGLAALAPEQVAPAMPAQPAPEMGGTGVDTLPVPEQEYADGGIVAFAGPEGSFVSGPTGFDEDFLAATGLSASDVSSLDKSILDQLRERALRPVERSADEEAYREYLKGQAERSAAAGDEAKAIALMNFGANLAASKSPRFLQAAGEAGQKTVPELARAKQAVREGEGKAMAARAALAKGEREEELKMKDLAARMYGYEAQKESALNSSRTTDARNYVSNYVATEQEKIAAGIRPAASKAALAVEGQQDYMRRQGEALTKAQAAGLSAESAAAQAATAASEKAEKAWRSASLIDPSVAKALADARKKDAELAAQGKEPMFEAQYKRDWVSRYQSQGPKPQSPGSATPTTPAGQKPAAAKPAPGGLPEPKVKAPSVDRVSGLPKDARFGKETTQGWEVFDKDGKLIGYAK